VGLKGVPFPPSPSQDSLGQAIEECTHIVPDGLLIFFPSYKLMEKLSARWKSTGQWQRIAKKKPIYSGKAVPPGILSLDAD
jgi:Rad3-related DNA helicase